MLELKFKVVRARILSSYLITTDNNTEPFELLNQEVIGVLSNQYFGLMTYPTVLFFSIPIEEIEILEVLYDPDSQEKGIQSISLRDLLGQDIDSIKLR